MYFIILFLLSLFGLFLLGVPAEILFYRGIIGLIVFGFYLWIMSFPEVKKHFEIIKEDREIRRKHWKEDWDLQILTSIIYMANGFCLSMFLTSGFILNRMGIGITYWNAEWWYNEYAPVVCIKMSFYLLVAIRLIILFADLHVIFFRNSPTKYFGIAACESCYTAGAIIFGLTTAGAYLAGDAPGIPANSYGEFLHEKFGRGWKYKVGTTHQQWAIQELKNHDIKLPMEKILDPNTNTVDNDKLESFLKENKKEILSKVSTVNRLKLGMTPRVWDLVLPEGKGHVDVKGIFKVFKKD